MITSLIPIIAFATLWCGSIILSTLPLSLIRPEGSLAIAATAICCIFTFATSYVVLAGVLSRPFQRGIVPGNFPRILTHRVYFARRVYGICWTSVYYFNFLYFVILSIPPLKKAVFYLFGYRGTNQFTIYPDTWIRDLPLVGFRQGAYVANKSTLGTNICLQDGNILVGPVRIGENSVVGHLVMIALGSTLGDGSELGSGVAVGVKVKIGKKCQISSIAGLNHGSQIGANCEIGAHAYIGLKAIIKDNIKLPAGTFIPDGAVVETQSDVEKYISSESYQLLQHRNHLSNLIKIPTLIPQP